MDRFGRSPLFSILPSVFHFGFVGMAPPSPNSNTSRDRKIPSKRPRSPSPADALDEPTQEQRPGLRQRKRVKLTLRTGPSPSSSALRPSARLSQTAIPSPKQLAANLGGILKSSFRVSPTGPPPPPRHKKHPQFDATVCYFARQLHPLVSTATGLAHPEFPTSLLQYHLLTHAQLDALSIHYHQVFPPVPETTLYPISIKPWIGTNESVSLDVKRRRFGQFIGMKGCESPTSPSFPFSFSSSSLPFSSRSTSGADWKGACSQGRRQQPRSDVEQLVERLISSAAVQNRFHKWQAKKQLRVHCEETVQQMLEHLEREWNRALARAKQHDWNSALGRKWRFYR